MIKIEREYKASSILSEATSTSWDKFRHKTIKVKLFGLTLFSTSEDLNIDYEGLGKSKPGFK